MTDYELIMKFVGLFSDRDDFQELLTQRPLFAHYTSIQTLEKIAKGEEIWLSNPLFMNDLEEMKFGINEGSSLFHQHSQQIASAAGTSERFKIIASTFTRSFQEFDTSYAVDTFVFCLSRHDPADNDGALSMWRAYGANGNGAALIFNTEHLTSIKNDSPLIMARVHYESGDGRRAWLTQRIKEWCNILQGLALTDHQLGIATRSLFTVIKVYALTSKHQGFAEEKEWRVIYLPERDTIGLRERNLDYIIGKNGVEPKLKIKIAPLPVSEPEEFTMGSILDRIILGPCVASPLAQACIIRMLHIIKRADWAKKVIRSTIPLRPT